MGGDGPGGVGGGRWRGGGAQRRAWTDARTVGGICAAAAALRVNILCARRCGQRSAAARRVAPIPRRPGGGATCMGAFPRCRVAFLGPIPIPRMMRIMRCGEQATPHPPRTRDRSATLALSGHGMCLFDGPQCPPIPPPARTLHPLVPEPQDFFCKCGQFQTKSRRHAEKLEETAPEASPLPRPAVTRSAQCRAPAT